MAHTHDPRTGAADARYTTGFLRAVFEVKQWKLYRLSLTGELLAGMDHSMSAINPASSVYDSVFADGFLAGIQGARLLLGNGFDEAWASWRAYEARGFIEVLPSDVVLVRQKPLFGQLSLV